MSAVAQQREMARLCVGCGACLGVCPTDAIKLKATKGILTVDFDYSRCTNCDMCIKVCPAVSNLYGRDLKIAEILGRVKKVFFGYSTNHDIRYHGASGGVVTALALYMLRHRVVDRVLVVKMKEFSAVGLLTDNERDVTSAQGSVYFKTFSLRLLQELLHHVKKGKRVCVIGLPCQILSLRTVLRGFRSKVFFIGLVCNHVNAIWYLDYIAGKYLPKSARPIAFGSRKDGWPGGVKVLFSLNGGLQELSIPLSKFWGFLPLLSISSPLGCLLCANHLAPMADVVAGDAWHPKFTGRSSSGVSILIARTIKGLRLVSEAVRNGVLSVEEATMRDLLIAQGGHVVEGSQYAPLRRKLLQCRIAGLRELVGLDKLLVALLLIVNRVTSQFEVSRLFLRTPLAEKFFMIASWLHARFKEVIIFDSILDLSSSYGWFP